jgi:hypothetical protein
LYTLDKPPKDSACSDEFIERLQMLDTTAAIAVSGFSSDGTETE